MVQRYVYDIVLGMNSEIPGYGPKGEWVKYEDYVALRGLARRLTLHVVAGDVRNLPDDLYEALEVEGIL